MSAARESETVVRVEDVRVEIAGAAVLRDVSLDVRRGEIVALVGASGAGKSVLLKTILGLLAPQRGRVEVLGVDPAAAPDDERRRLQRRWGVAFQHAALYTSLTVAENVEVPLRHQLDLPEEATRELALLRLSMVGLAPGDGAKLPAALSGGMRKRASIARALAASPELLFLDEPTSGLDPVGAAALDDLIGRLRRALGLSVLMVTHDLDSIHALCDRATVLVDGRVVAEGTLDRVQRSSHPWVRGSFGGRRGRAAARSATPHEAGR